MSTIFGIISVPYAVMAAFSTLIIGLTLGDEVENWKDLAKLIFSSMLMGFLWPVTMSIMAIILIMSKFMNTKK